MRTLSTAERVRNTVEVHARARLERTVPFWPAAAIERRQRRRVAAMVRHAYATVPFYRRAMDKRGLLPGDFSRAADLARLPLIDGALVRQSLDDFLSTGYDDRRREPAYTSGSETGLRRIIYWEYDSMVMGLAYLERIWPILLRLAGESRPRLLLRELVGETAARAILQWLGRDTGGYRMLSIRPEDPLTRPLREIWSERTLAPRAPTHEEELSPLVPYEEIVAMLRQERPRLMFSYGSYAEQFVRFLLDREIDVELPKVWFYTGDRVPEDIRLIARDRFGCLLWSAYQTSEAGRIGYQCERLQGHHLNVDLCAVRVVDGEGRDVEPGQPGEIVISSLRNRAMPLLNYRIGDLGVLARDPCPCGRRLPLLRRLDGRRSESVVLADRRTVSSLDLEWLFRTPLRSALKAQVAQRGAGWLHWRIVPFGGADPRTIERELLERARAILDDGTAVTVEFVDDLASTGMGKFPRVVREPLPDIEV